MQAQDITPLKSDRSRKRTRKFFSPDLFPSSIQKPRPPPSAYKRKPRTPLAEPEPEDVERIHDMRVNAKGEVEYYVEFKGHPMSLAEWVPHNRMDCPDRIVDFIASYKSSMSTPPLASSNSQAKNSCASSPTLYSLVAFK